jgi:hypothetical protein
MTATCTRSGCLGAEACTGKALAGVVMAARGGTPTRAVCAHYDPASSLIAYIAKHPASPATTGAPGPHLPILCIGCICCAKPWRANRSALLHESDWGRERYGSALPAPSSDSLHRGCGSKAR